MAVNLSAVIAATKLKSITDYIEGKQTQRQLTDKYGESSRTIARDLENMRYVRKIARNKHVVIQMGLIGDAVSD